MPVEFLTEEQRERYGRFAAEPSAEQLAKYFHLNTDDRKLISSRRGPHNKIGFAIQLTTARFLGTFLSDVSQVPLGVIRYLASQLGVHDVACVRRYTSNVQYHHAAEIRNRCGYRAFSDQPEHFRLVRLLYARSWVTNQRPSMLFDMATSWLVENKVLLPGVSVLARLVARVRDRASLRLWDALSVIPTPRQRTRLEGLLSVPNSGRPSKLDRLRHAPTRSTATGLKNAIERLRELRAVGVHGLNLSRLPSGRIDALARFANTARVQALARMPEKRRLATLLAFAHAATRTACDDVLDVFDDFVLTAFGRAERRGSRARFKSQKELDAAALLLREMYLVVFDPAHSDTKKLSTVRRAVFRRVPKEELRRATETVAALARPPDDRYYERVIRGYCDVRKFLDSLIDTVPFGATTHGKPVLDALMGLPKITRRRRIMDVDDAIVTGIVPQPWRRHVFPSKGMVDRHAYTYCVLDQLQKALRRRDVFVNESTRWADPRRLFLDGDAWTRARPQVLHAIQRNADAGPALDELAKELDAAYIRAEKRLDDNPAVRIEKKKGRDTIVLSPLDALDEPPSLKTLADQVSALLPRVDLPDVLLEVSKWTGFTEEFTHVSEGRTRVDDIDVSICAVLVAQACNIGFEPTARPGNPALTLGRLSWVAQNCVRGETLARANARLVDYQAKIPLAQAWGGGEVASADGMRFVVPVRTINARPNPKYFNTRRGVTYYNFLSDQISGFHGIVIPGTLRDSPYILDGLLENQTSLNPTQLMTDTAGYSDVVFGLFWLLGFQFSPRLADLGDARLWRTDAAANYGRLNAVARHRVNLKPVRDHWEDILRVAGTLLSGKVAASEVIRALLAGGRLTTLARAITTLGRIPKTIHLLNFIDDEDYRRSILTQLNRQEGRHGLGRVVFHGQRGELRQRYREGQEDQLGALGLVINAIVLWNTRYMDAALTHLGEQEHEIRDADKKRLSPLGHKHLNVHGRYHFAMPEPVMRGELRDLRDPDDPSEDDIHPE